MSAKVPADLTDAFYALTLVFQETPIPDQTDRKPLIRRDVLIEQLDGYQIGEIRANQFIDWLVGVGVFEAHDPVLKEGETIEVDLSGAITLGEQDRGTKITPIRTLAIDRGAWERLQAGAMAAASEDTAGEAEPLTGGERDKVFEALKPAERKAHLAFEYAESKRGCRLEDREAYDFLIEHGIAADQGDLGPLVDYDLPAFDTWARQLRNARKALGEQKYKRRGRIPKTRSIVKGNQIENQKGEGA